jgi:hypothetical protein
MANNVLIMQFLAEMLRLQLSAHVGTSIPPILSGTADEKVRQLTAYIAEREAKNEGALNALIDTLTQQKSLRIPDLADESAAGGSGDDEHRTVGGGYAVADVEEIAASAALRYAKPNADGNPMATGNTSVVMTTCLFDGSAGDGTEAVTVRVWNQNGQRRVQCGTGDVFKIMQDVAGDWTAIDPPTVDIYYDS